MPGSMEASLLPLLWESESAEEESQREAALSKKPVDEAWVALQLHERSISRLSAT